MKYYLIAGEASGDLHASRLMSAIKSNDPAAEFRFFGGDMMQAVGGTMMRHYRQLAYMGFVPVIMHLPTILRNMSMCKRDIVQWQPDALILIDYPGFNLKVAKYIKSHTDIPIYYYISPKIWAWKEYRIKNIKKDIDALFSILPFEIPFFEKKHHYPIHYVGNPTVSEVKEFKSTYNGEFPDFGKPIIALLAGSRQQEIKDNLPAMIEATAPLSDRYQMVIAGAPGITPEVYDKYITDTGVKVVFGQTYPLLEHSVAALVTSGTATLETALFKVPQVVCYKTPLPKLISLLRKFVLKVKYVSLVNLIGDREIVPELVAGSFSIANIRRHLMAILPGGECRDKMIEEYHTIFKVLGDKDAPSEAAKGICELIKKRHI